MKSLPLYTLLAVTLASASASAQVIYQDSFTRGTTAAPLSLYGTSPDVANLTGATWTADGNGGVDFTTNGTVANVTGGSDNREANLAFSITAANLPAGASLTSGLLTLSATVTSNTAGGWVALGFSTGTSALYGPGLNWMLLTPDNSIQAFAGTTGTGTQAINTAATGGNSTTAVLSISLDLATNQVTFSRDGTILGNSSGTTSFAAGTLSSITQVNITDLHPTTGSVDDYTLSYTAAVPEPSTLALLLCGGVFAMVMVVRIRRAKAQV